MMTKNEILKRYNVDSLSSVEDEELIRLAKFGELGIETMYSAAMKWAFPDIHILADKIREAIELGKELRVMFTEGEYYGKEEVKTEFV